MKLNFWRESALSFSSQINDVICVKGGKILEYKGIKSISIINTTVIKSKDFKIPEMQEFVLYL